LHTRFSDDYVAERRGMVSVEVPEVYELANIALAITETGLNNPYREHKQGDYYQRVLEHFLPFKDHPLIEAIDYGDEQYGDYYGFRENSIAYHFEGDAIRHGGVYGSAWTPDRFHENLTLVEDFARASDFRQFYQENLPYYQAQVADYEARVPLRHMWTWLEEQFPNRHDSYRIIFSPLIGRSHSTQSFADNGLSETLMFVAGPELYRGEVAPDVEEALLARVVFTEIDHNYVNPMTDQYQNKVKLAFYRLPVWNAQQEGAGYYIPANTFNEYMTWALFILYARDSYVPHVAEEATARVVDLMVEGRGFTEFGPFTQALLDLYDAREPGQTVADLYPALLDWAARHQKAS
jgi:hypothetical protein